MDSTRRCKKSTIVALGIGLLIFSLSHALAEQGDKAVRSDPATAPIVDRTWDSEVAGEPRAHSATGQPERPKGAPGSIRGARGRRDSRGLQRRAVAFYTDSGAFTAALAAANMVLEGTEDFEEASVGDTRFPVPLFAPPLRFASLSCFLRRSGRDGG